MTMAATLYLFVEFHGSFGNDEPLNLRLIELVECSVADLRQEIMLFEAKS